MATDLLNYRGVDRGSTAFDQRGAPVLALWYWALAFLAVAALCLLVLRRQIPMVRAVVDPLLSSTVGAGVVSVAAGVPYYYLMALTVLGNGSREYVAMRDGMGLFIARGLIVGLNPWRHGLSCKVRS